jgi:hypothetical protein
MSSLKNDCLKGNIPVTGVMFGTHNIGVSFCHQLSNRAD